MSHTIRDFVESDLQDYLRLSREFYNTGAVLHTVPEENFTRTFDACISGSPYTRGLALMLDNELAGYALISLTWSNEVGGICVLLEEAYISPKFQGRGLGSAFLSFAEREYGERARRLRLEVTHSNERAISLYERMGYQRFDYLQMIKDL